MNAYVVLTGRGCLVQFEANDQIVGQRYFREERAARKFLLLLGYKVDHRLRRRPVQKGDAYTCVGPESLTAWEENL